VACRRRRRRSELEEEDKGLVVVFGDLKYKTLQRWEKEVHVH
jgi:hypothetical protein